MLRFLVLIIVFSLFLVCTLSREVKAQDASTRLYNTYAQSLLYPESFDRYIEKNRDLFDQDFLSCVNGLFEFYAPRSKERGDYCNRIADPRARSNCWSQNQPALVGMWLLSLVARLNGTPWLETFSGSDHYRKKIQACQMVGCEQFISFGRQVLPMTRPLLQCE